jgi:hypothetical protein
MICPNCGGYSETCAACDTGEPELLEGMRCPHCGVCVPDDDWIDPADDDQHFDTSN